MDKKIRLKGDIYEVKFGYPSKKRKEVEHARTFHFS